MFQKMVCISETGKDGRLEEWKSGRVGVEEWGGGRVEEWAVSHPSILVLPSFLSSASLKAPLVV